MGDEIQDGKVLMGLNFYPLLCNTALLYVMQTVG
jgi:hypothetical protein